MFWAKRTWLRGAFVAAVLIAMCVPASAQLMKQVPKEAVFVVVVNDLQSASGKLRDFAKRAGIDNPAMADPLGFVKEQLGVKQGLKEDGQLALAIFAPGGFGGPSGVALVPVTDYKQFVGNFPDVAKEGDVDVFKSPNGAPLYAMQWGDWAAVTNAKELLGKERGIEVSEPVARMMKERDAAGMINIAALRPMVLPQLQFVKNMMGRMPGRPGQNANEVAAARVVMSKGVELIEKLFKEGEALVIGATITNERVLAGVLVSFAADSDAGKVIQTAKNTDQDLLKGLPDAKYLFLMGVGQTGDGFNQLMDTFYVPMIQAMPFNAEERQKLEQAISLTKKFWDATESMAFGLVPPTGDIKQTGLIHGFSVLRGDGKTMFDLQRKLQEYQELMQKIGGQEGAKVTIKQNARTIDGVSLDQQVTEMSQIAQNNEPAAQILQAMFGGGSMTTDTGLASDKAIVSAVNVEDAQIQALIASVKQGLSPSDSDAMKAAVASLPKQRVAVMFINLGQIAQTAANSGAEVPEALKQLPVIGMTISAEGNAVRMDANVPNAVIDAAAGAVNQIERRAPRGGRQRGDRL